MINLNKHSIYNIFSCAILVLGILGSIALYVLHSFDRIQNHNMVYLEDLGEQKTLAVEDNFLNKLRLLTVSSKNNSFFKEDFSTDKNDEFLSICKELDFSRLILVSKDNIVMDTGVTPAQKENYKHYIYTFSTFIGEEAKHLWPEYVNIETLVTQSSFFEEYTSKKASLTNVDCDMLFVNPIDINGEKYLLIGVYDVDKIISLISYKIFGFDAKPMLADINGNIFASPAKSVLFGNFFAMMTFIPNIEGIKADLYKDRKIAYSYPGADYDSVGYIACFRKTDFMLIFNFPSHAAQYIREETNKDAYKLVVMIFITVLCFSLLLVIRFFYEKKSYVKAIKNAEYDPLTKLYNRTHMDEYLAHAKLVCEKNHTSFCLIMIDLDDFKKVNDTYGHDCGDLVLKSVADIVLLNIRNNDYAFRYGGEEILILVDGSIDIAILVAQRIKSTIAATSIDYESEKVSVTATLGVSEFSPLNSIDALIKEADTKMYEGKRKGKNVVIS